MAYSWTVVRTTVKTNRGLMILLNDGWYVVHCNKIGEELEYILEYEHEGNEEEGYED